MRWSCQIWWITLDVHADDTAPPAATPGPAPVSAHLARIHRRLLEAATDRAVPAKQLIRQAGYLLNSYSRQAITDLVRWGYLLRTPEGLRRAAT